LELELRPQPLTLTRRMDAPKERELSVRLDQSSPWEARLFWLGLLSAAGGLLLGPGNLGEFAVWGPPTTVGVVLLGTALSIRMLSSSQARVEPTRVHIFSTSADDPTIAHREIDRSEVRMIEVMRVKRDGWLGTGAVWEVAALLGSNRRQPLVAWGDAEQAIQAARSSARVLDVEFRDADIEEKSPIGFPTAQQPAASFAAWAEGMRTALDTPGNLLHGIGFDASADAVKLYLWKQQLRGFMGILWAGCVALTGVLAMGLSCIIAHVPRYADLRVASGVVYVLGLVLAAMMFRHLRHLGQRNILIVRPGDVGVQGFTKKGEPVLRALPIAEAEYILVTQPPGLLVVGADREVCARGGISRREYMKIAELLREVPGWPRHAEVKA